MTAVKVLLLNQLFPKKQLNNKKRALLVSKVFPVKALLVFLHQNLPLGTPIGGKIKTSGEETFGISFAGTANDVANLTFERTSGNLNLGIVVLDKDNNTVFQTSAITTIEINDTFILPSTGQYTLGVFRIDLLPVASPTDTSFQIKGCCTVERMLLRSNHRGFQNLGGF